MKISGIRVTWVWIAAMILAATQVVAQAEPQADTASPVFARVNGEVILQRTYETALRVAGRQRFYHGKAPEAELIAFRKEVAEELIKERIFHQEAIRQGLKPNSSWVDAEFAKIQKRYSASPQWHESGAALQQQIRLGLAERSLIKQVDDALRVVSEPSEAEIRDYYAANPDKFTSPEQIKVSSILLKVEPWQPKEVWDDTQRKAEQIHHAIVAGESFDDFAAQYPPENSAQLGYIHRGMLGESAQSAIDKLQEGQITEVVTLLEGLAIFRLDARRPAALNPYEKVRDRAAGLVARDKSEQRYRERTEVLRASAKVEYTNPGFYKFAAVGRLHDGKHLKPTPKEK